MKAICLALALAASPALAQSYIEEGIGLRNGVRYLSGGMTPEAMATMREAADEYNLRIEFAAGSPPRYVSASRVRVQGPAGRTVLKLRAAGPLLYVDLPRGRYLVRAVRGGIERIREVVVGEYSGMSARFAWPRRLPAAQPAWQG